MSEILKYFAEWIPVAEQLPTHNHSVLAWVTASPNHFTDDGGFASVCSWIPRIDKWAMPDGIDDIHVAVSHWMPLPEPPSAPKE